MKKATIGTIIYGDTNVGGDVAIDVPTLMETRLLIQSNSGGGKSYAARKVIEATNGKAQQIIIDIDGEFTSLREEFDFILAGKGGDIPADVRSAGLLATRALEMEFDLIIDLSELKRPERIEYVRRFLEALMDADKSLYHPLLVFIDEVHIFCPEKGDAVSADAVVDLMSRGRKRGFCGVLCTQRLSKLKKDAAAEAVNKLIGRTNLDLDVKRALDELDFSTSQKTDVKKRLPGEFWSYGPALTVETTLIKIGEVITTHPKAGKRIFKKAPAPTHKVKATLEKLKDLPKEAEAEAKNLEVLKARVKELERSLKSIPKAPELDPKMFEKQTEKMKKVFENETKKVMKVALLQIKNKFNESVTEVMAELKLEGSSFDVTQITRERIAVQKIQQEIKPHIPKKVITAADQKFIEDSQPKSEIGQCGRKILGFLLMKKGESLPKSTVAAMTGYAVSGSFNNSVSELYTNGFIEKQGSNISLRLEKEAEVEQIVGNETPHRLEDWVSKLGACQKAIYETVLQNPDQLFTKEELAAMNGYEVSGSFNTAISKLNTLNLIKKNTDGKIGFNRDLS